MKDAGGGKWQQRLFGAVGLVLAVALGARLAWWLIAPLLPWLVGLAVLGTVYGLVFGRRR